MKLGSLKTDSRDGELVVISRDGSSAVSAKHIAPSLREAIENWAATAPKLEKIYADLNAGDANGAFKIKPEAMASAMPRAFQWADGSAFLHHVRLVRKARGAELPDNLLRVPLMYQGAGDIFLAPTDDIPQIHENQGTDFEAEVAVITDDVPMGVSPQAALKHIKLFVLVNDVTLRGLIPEELANGFGFFQSKPTSALSPIALTPDELGTAWKDGRVHLPLFVEYNGQLFGQANGSEMHFHFGDLIAHAAKTRDLAAGTVIGSGTFSNEDKKAGSSCLVEKRTIEKIENGESTTPFMKVGDTVKIWMTNAEGKDLFGRIFQKVTKV